MALRDDYTGLRYLNAERTIIQATRVSDGGFESWEEDYSHVRFQFNLAKEGYFGEIAPYQAPPPAPEQPPVYKTADAAFSALDAALATPSGYDADVAAAAIRVAAGGEIADDLAMLATIAEMASSNIQQVASDIADAEAARKAKAAKIAGLRLWATSEIKAATSPYRYEEIIDAVNASIAA